jgi:hypothetical protein
MGIMNTFCAKFREEPNGGKESWLIRADNILDALDKACGKMSELGESWEIDQLFPVDEAETPNIPFMNGENEANRENKFYHPKHFYQVMVVEGTRLLNVKQNGKNNSYGSLLRNVDTGETCFASPDGVFYDHKQIKKLRQKYFPEEIFPWHPVYFPLTADGKVDLTHYITCRYQLTFPMQFWGHESYDKQVEWLAKQEGLE